MFGLCCKSKKTDPDFAEWHQQATRETGLRPDIALDDPRLIDLTEDDSYDWLEDVDYVTVVQDE